MTAAPFNAYAVLRKWGFLRYNPSSERPLAGTWFGDLDGAHVKVPPEKAYRFAHELLMRN